MCIRDRVLALAPVDDQDAAALPGLIRAKKLLGSFRGYPPVDTAALAKVVQAIGQIALIIQRDLPDSLDDLGKSRRIHRGIPTERAQQLLGPYQAGQRGGILVVDRSQSQNPVSYTHLRAHETVLDLVC